jgi:hypothetical protein
MKEYALTIRFQDERDARPLLEKLKGESFTLSYDIRKALLIRRYTDSFRIVDGFSTGWLTRSRFLLYWCIGLLAGAVFGTVGSLVSGCIGMVTGVLLDTLSLHRDEKGMTIAQKKADLYHLTMILLVDEGEGSDLDDLLKPCASSWIRTPVPQEKKFLLHMHTAGTD